MEHLQGIANDTLYVQFDVPVTLQVVQLILGLAIVIVNVFVMVAYGQDRDIRSVPANVFILHLSISDFLTGLVLIVRFAWIVQDPLVSIHMSTPCLVIGAAHLASLIMSVLFVILISWDRYLMVSNPFKYRQYTVSRAMRIAICSWSFVLLYILLIVFGFPGIHQLIFHAPLESTFCIETQIPREAVFLSLWLDFVVPFFLLLYFNGGVNYKLRKATLEKYKKQRLELDGVDNPSVSTRDQDSCTEVVEQTGYPENIRETQMSVIDKGKISNNSNQNPQEERIKQSAKRELRKVLRTAGILRTFIAVFCLNWLPFYIVLIVNISKPVPANLITVASLNVSLNSFVNPFLYAFMSRKIRRRLHLLIKCRTR